MLSNYYTVLIKIVWYLIIYVVYFANHNGAVDYCKANICNGSKEHTLCKFSGPSSDCVESEGTIINEKDIQLILNKINSRRNKVASGDIKSLPPAQSMIKLEWNEELALSAQRWANQCVDKKQNSEDTCRDLENTPVGQNVATVYGDSPGLSPHVLVDLWYMELLNINASIIHYYQPSSVLGQQHYDYFTQLVWGATKEVGCGGVKFKVSTQSSEVQKKYTVYRLVCNFAPAGNRIGEAVYVTGEPCLKCPVHYSCNSEYNYLCSKSDTSNIYKLSGTHTNVDFLEKYKLKLKHDRKIGTVFNNTLSSTKSVDIKELQTSENSDSGDSFDLLSHLFETTSSIQETTQTTSKCQDVQAVEEFIRLLKNKLNSEHLIREYIFSTKIFNAETPPSDETIADIVQRIYSKNIPSTTTISTENENINSTLLANLVEAVIFRQSDQFTVTEKISSNTLSLSDVRPVKIHAALGEVKTNKEFTGHYFFPEEEEVTSDSENTDPSDYYYDSTNLPLSEKAFEIEDINKNTRTKTFLDEVLEEELLKEGASDDAIAPTIKDKISYPNFFSTSIKRLKRRHKHKTYKAYGKTKTNDRIYQNYYYLLKKIASDLRHLNLNERFSCAYNGSLPLMHVFDSLLFYTVILYHFLANIY